MVSFRRTAELPPLVSTTSGGVFGSLAGQVLDQVRGVLRAELDRALIIGAVGLLAVMVAGSVLVFALWGLLDAAHTQAFP